MTPPEVFYLLTGALIGFGYQRIYQLAQVAFGYNPRPMRLVRTRFDTVTPAVTVEPPHRFGMWITYTHAYILRGELCVRRPLNVREMAALTGLSSRQQGKYLDVLKQGRVIAVVPSGGVRWLVGKRDRRRLLPRLPYPHDIDPPPFQARSGRDGCNSA